MVKKSLDDFRNLDVYQRMYRLMKVILTKVIPKLPKEEKYDLVDQIRRASKAAPALLAEAYPKRFQFRHWQRYLTDTVGECQEMVHHLSVVKDIYGEYINPDSIQKLIEEYIICCKQIMSLGKSFRNYHQS